MKHSYYDVNQYVLENTATGYYYSRGKNNPIEFNKMPVLGSGGLNATGLDIGNFIIALLQKGNYEGNFILSEKSASDMQERHFSAGHFTNGICYSFFESIFNGYRVLEHGGAELGFTSDLKLIPETGIGYFISTNADPYSEGSEEFERQLFYQFMKRFSLQIERG